MSSKRWLMVISLVLVLQATAFAGNAWQQALKVRELYESLQFEEAVALSSSLLKSDYSFSREELITIHQYAGYAFFNLGKADSAKSHFLSLLSINPDYRFDPVNTSPKIIRFFNKIKESFLQERLKNNNPPYVKYIFLEDLRPGAGWRSAVLPGWGQYYKNQRQRGKIFAGVFLTAGLIGCTAAVMEKVYHNKYLDSATPSAINTNYSQYNFWFKTRRWAVYLTAAVWSVSVVDALLLPYDATRLAVYYNEGPTLSLHISF